MRARPIEAGKRYGYLRAVRPTTDGRWICACVSCNRETEQNPDHIRSLIKRGGHGCRLCMQRGDSKAKRSLPRSRWLYRAFRCEHGFVPGMCSEGTCTNAGNLDAYAVRPQLNQCPRCFRSTARPCTCEVLSEGAATRAKQRSEQHV